MSYILEALKKSDQKRQKGHVPDLNTVQIEFPPEDKKKALWPYILVGILFLNAVVLAVIMLPDKSIVEPQSVVQDSGKQNLATTEEKQAYVEPQSTHALSSVDLESNLATVVPTVDGNIAASQEEMSPVLIKDESVEASIVHEPYIEAVDSKFTRGMSIVANPEEIKVSVLKPITDGVVEEMEIELSKGVNLDTDQNAPQVEPIQELATDSTIIKEIAKDNVPEPEHIIAPQEDSVIVVEPEPIESTTLPDEQLEVIEVTPRQQRKHAVLETSVPDEEKTKTKREPLHMMQLPSSIQEQLPEFRISAHVYFAKKPASRLASINGKIVREGQKLVPDLKVEEITSDGVIFSYRGYLFHVPI